MRTFFKTAILIGLGASACGDDATDTPSETATQAVSIDFAAQVAGADFSCAETYNLGTATTPSQISDFKLYVSGVEMLKADGTAMPVTLENDGKWQDDFVTLLDFEDGTGACANGNSDLNLSVKGEVAKGEYTGVRFKLGVPFEHNHSDAATAPAPLNLVSMFWSWQGGYKFLRIDGKANEGGFRVHLGSTGCVMGADDAIESCANENLPVVTLNDFNVATDRVVVDAAALFAGVDMTPDVDNNSSVCMSTPDHAACNQVFPTLGLKFGTTPAGNQTVFAKANKP